MGEVSRDSFVGVHQLYLAKLDEAYQALRAMAANPQAINTDWPPYKEALKEFNEVQADILAFKVTWHQARRLAEEAPNDSR